MSEKKRTTVTTIETHEVWIIRKVAPEPTEAAVMITTLETAQPDPNISSELTNNSEPSTEKEP